MIENSINNHKNLQETFEMKKLIEGNTTKFVYTLDGKDLGNITLIKKEEEIYDIGGLFVDPTYRGKGISSELVKAVNAFLDSNKSIGKLINTIKGDAALVYENNKWVKGEYKSQDAYGGYEYIYDPRKNL